VANKVNLAAELLLITRNLNHFKYRCPSVNTVKLGTYNVVICDGKYTEIIAVNSVVC
jgi:hypothetical protein